jgi:ABC-type nitrate/sulfonate/bicarbonate transport system substrate-binding protein
MLWRGTLFILAATLAFSAAAAAQRRKVNIVYTATSPYQAAAIIARETGLFRKHGLDVTMIFTSGGSLGIQAMVSGDVAINVSDGAASAGPKLLGIDNVMVASFLNTFPYSLISLPEINQVSQLKGTSVAVSRFGGSTDLSARMALGRLGWNADKNVAMQQSGALYGAAIETGAVDDYHPAVHAHGAQARLQFAHRYGVKP